MAEYDDPRPSSQPVGTTELVVAKDNLITLDTMVNSEELTLTNRKGKEIKTLSGLESAVIYGIGWTIVGDFAIGVTVTNANDVLQYDGGLWRTSESLPYTTDGATPDADSGEWLVVSDGVLSGIARGLNVGDDEVIYATDTTTLLDSILYIYDANTQTTWKKPDDVGSGEYITDVTGDQLTTTVNTYTLIEHCPINNNNISGYISDYTDYLALSVADMINLTVVGGATVDVAVGDVWSTGKTKWKVTSIPVTSLANFDCLGSFVSARDLGFNYDGTTDNLAAYNSAVTLLSSSSLGIDFDEVGTVYISSSRPDLSALKIKANKDFILKVDQNPNVKDMQLASDLTINNTVHATTLVKHKNLSNDFLASAGASLSQGNYSQPEKIEFTSSDVSLASISGVGTKGAFTGSNGAAFLFWSSDFASGQEGAFVPFEFNAFYEVAFRQIGAPVGGGPFRSVAILMDSDRIDFAVNIADVIWRVISSVSGVVDNGDTPNGGAYSLSEDGSITMALRVNEKLEAEFFINSTLIVKYQLDEVPNEVAFLTSSGESSTCQINNLTKQSQKIPFTSSPTSVAIVGDSISYGAWASDPYDEILKKTFQACGLGEITSVNYAESGSSSGEWISGGSIDITTKDLTNSEYTLIMLGTNDVQGDVSESVFDANIRSIVASVQAQGSKPVLGVFPVWTTASVSGVTGVTTSNYSKGGYARQLVKWIAADLEIPVSEVCEAFGTNIGLYGDNIHPTEEGQVIVASAFARAILADKGSSNTTLDRKSTTVTLLNSWVTIGSYGDPELILKDRVVSFTGSITGGATGSIIATISDTDYIPDRTKVFSCSGSDAVNAIVSAQIRIDTNGDVTLTLASATPTVLWLDDIRYDV